MERNKYIYIKKSLLHKKNISIINTKKCKFTLNMMLNIFDLYKYSILFIRLNIYVRNKLKSEIIGNFEQEGMSIMYKEDLLLA